MLKALKVHLCSGLSKVYWFRAWGVCIARVVGEAFSRNTGPHL